MIFTPGAFLTEVQVDKVRFGLDSPQELFKAVLDNVLPGLDLPGRDGGLSYYFRGQRDASWGITSSLYRAMPPSLPGTHQRWEPDLLATEQRVLSEMRHQGLGRLMNDGETLMVLQHHGVPTRLIDVSEQALEALFFAVERDDATAGRLFLLGLLPGNSMDIPLAGPPDQPLPWAEFGRGRKQSVAAWTNQIWVIQDASLDPRMRAQRGKFLVGGLPKAYAGGTQVRFGGRPVGTMDVQRLCNLSVAFPTQHSRKKVTSRAAAAWNIEIPGAWKPALRELLAGEHVDHDSMYPPFAESRRLGEYVALQGSALHA